MSTNTAIATATDLPLAAGTWPLDSTHSGVNFKVRHIGLSSVHGRFNRFDATLTVGETLVDTPGSRRRSRCPPSTPTSPTVTPTCSAPTRSPPTSTP